MSAALRRLPVAIATVAGQPGAHNAVRAAAVRFQSNIGGRKGSAPVSTADANFSLDALLTDDEAATKVVKRLVRKSGPLIEAISAPESMSAGAASISDAEAGEEAVVDDLEAEADPEIKKFRQELRSEFNQFSQAIAEIDGSEGASGGASVADAVGVASDSDEAMEALADGSAMRAIVDSSGRVLPVHSDDEAGLPLVSPSHISPEDARRSLKALAYHAQHVRASVEEPADLALYSAALEREFGSDLEIPSPLSGLRPSDYAVGDDPLIDGRPGGLPFAPSGVGFKTYMTWNAAPGSRKVDRRAVLFCRVGDLGLAPPVAQYVRAIAGGHYNGRTDGLRISVDWHPDAGLNKRQALETLVGLVTAAEGLAGAHGPMRNKVRFPKYSY